MNMPALPPEQHHDSDHVYFTADQMLAYGKACAAAERESCAKVAEEADDLGSVNMSLIKKRIARTIRARKDTK